MLDMKRTMNDPHKVENDVSRALDFAFDCKNLANLGAIKDDSLAHIKAVMLTSQGYKDANQDKAKLKINSEQIISLDEKNDFSSSNDGNMSLNAYG